MKVAIGSDHGGYKLKETIKKTLTDLNIKFEDFGVYSADRSDYPDITVKVSNLVVSKQFDRAILICGTGIGVSVAANKVKGIRAALCCDVFSAVMSRKHTDANILCLGERVTGSGLASMIVDCWFSTEFEGGRHADRIAMVTKIDEGTFC